jgi:3-oxoacyl-[acyl-carrier protein] reductase
MDLQIAGKIAIVGGGSKGLGLACAKALAAEGCNVVLIARQQETLEKARSEITSEFKVDCSLISADLSSLGGITKCKQILADKFSDASILINNVGGPKPVDALGADSDDWQRGFEQLFLSTIELTKLYVPLMQKRGFGRVLTISSMTVFEPAEMLTISTGMRAGVSAYMKSLSNEVAAQGVTVNMVVPGVIHTDRIVELRQAKAQRNGSTVEAEIYATAQKIPIKRLGAPEELGATVAYLCSRQASYITGANITVDGGMRKSW